MALAGSATIVLAVPAQSIRGVLTELAPVLPPGAALVNTAKGIEIGSGMLLAEVIGEIVAPAHAAVLSGPSFAADVRAGRPVAVSLAAEDESAAARLQELFTSLRFRVYRTDDMVGVQLGGAYKNVVAIACGIATGLGLGDSARAALTARGFAELTRLGEVMGSRPKTLEGLSGLGDIVLSCASPQSRNFTLGVGLGEGLAPEDAASRAGLAEGLRTAGAAHILFRKHGIDAPICEVVKEVAAGTATIGDVVQRLLSRVPRGAG